MIDLKHKKCLDFRAYGHMSLSSIIISEYMRKGVEMSSSKLAVGIVGLPNAGKSTLLNALAARRLSPTASHPHSELSIHLYLS